MPKISSNRAASARRAVLNVRARGPQTERVTTLLRILARVAIYIPDECQVLGQVDRLVPGGTHGLLTSASMCRKPHSTSPGSPTAPIHLPRPVISLPKGGQGAIWGRRKPHPKGGPPQYRPIYSKGRKEIPFCSLPDDLPQLSRCVIIEAVKGGCCAREVLVLNLRSSISIARCHLAFPKPSSRCQPRRYSYDRAGPVLVVGS